MVGNIRRLGGLTVGTTIITRRAKAGEATLQVWDGSHRWKGIKKLTDDNLPEDEALIATLQEVKVIVFKYTPL
jgi:hypothetical protein